MSKTAKLLKWLLSGRAITPKQAWKKWGLYRLADSIFKLKRRGYSIVTVLVRKGRDIYATYKLEKQ
jgi:hypothetical protein